MPVTKKMVKTVIGFVCGILSFLLLVPTGYWTWLGLACAMVAVFLGWFGKPENKLQERLGFGGIILAVVAGLLFLATGLL